MSTFIIHLLVPTMAVLSTRLVTIRNAWIWSWPAWAGDLDYATWALSRDYAVPNLHRALFHNIWWLVLMGILAAFAWRRWRAENGAYFPAFFQASPQWLLMPFFYSTHLILDFFQGGFTVFWPASSFWARGEFALEFDTSTPIPTPNVEASTETFVGVQDVSTVYTWMNSEEFAFLVLYLAGLTFVILHEALRRRKVRKITAPGADA